MPWLDNPTQAWVTLFYYQRLITWIIFAVGGLFLVLPLLRSIYIGMAQLVLGSAFLVFSLLLWGLLGGYPYAYLILTVATLLQMTSGVVTIRQAWRTRPSRRTEPAQPPPSPRDQLTAPP